MRQLFGIALMAFFLTGCATRSIDDARKNGEQVTLESKRSADEVSQCILYKWQNKKDIIGSPFGATIQPLPGGSTVYVDGNLFVADVTKKNEGNTQVKLYLLNLRNGWVDLTKTCL
ncbi:hypothetical protein [Rosenbergiella metrosideri]|uniref:hypothetical protein n=1 Tax=Rosenbergiella metrosideri TaxID=2921185 RepID=UPI001F4F55CC|nr:hypothetical protein [Rosenbergiella metrosideri]